MQFDATLIEKTGIMGLLYLVLAGIGVFIARAGFRMVDAIRENTTAVKDLAINVRDLVHQHEEDALAAKEKIDSSTRLVLDTLKEGLRDVREELQRKDSRGSKPDQ